MKLLFILLLSLPLYAQNKINKIPKRNTPVVTEPTVSDINKYEQIDKQIFVDTSQTSIQQLADRFKSFPTEEAKVRAIYMWITKNIAYDANQMFAFNFNETANLSTEQILRTRKGVCVDYALLFNELCTKVGIKSYIIEGYAKVGKSVSDFGHAWNAVRLDGKWYLFDSTWGAGYVSGQTFTREPNDIFFMIDPAEFIYTHMPFDPLWQFLEYPITNQEFYSNKNKSDNTNSVFHFNDSLSVYDQQTYLKRLELSEKRIEKNGNTNNMTYMYLRDMKVEIMQTYYSRGVNAYNSTVQLLKDFVNYRIARFMPPKSDEAIKKMLSDTQTQLAETKKIVSEIPLKNKELIEKVAEIKKLMPEVEVSIKEQEQFLQRYFKVWKPMRKVQF